MNNLKQLALNLCLKDAATFVNFFVGANKQLINVLCNLDADNKTHCDPQSLLKFLSYGNHHPLVTQIPKEIMKRTMVETWQNWMIIRTADLERMLVENG